MEMELEDPAFQVIVLGPTGGPKEDAVTGLLVRSTSTTWSKSSVVAVDAGTLLAGIVRILDQTLVTDKKGRAVVNGGPFVGLQPPHKTSHANAAYIFREVIASVLITHPHLDHMSGLAINTPIVEASNGPKTVAGLPSTISAMKYHMFNDIIWPNLSDEDGGAGLITYQRLVEGGNPRFGRGDSRGYVRACDGLVTKCLSVSHGRCKQRYDAESGRHHRIGSSAFAPDQMAMSSARNLSFDQGDGSIYSPARSPHIGSGLGATPSKDSANWGVVESSAFFIRDDSTGKEIIIFGDIEPDSISLEPRNKRVWEIAAPKIVSGSLQAIFIECSYNDAIDDETLYGHLCPRHLIAELKVLASKVEDSRPDHQQKGQRRRGRSSKRKRKDSDTADDAREQPMSPHTTRQVTTYLAKPSDSHGDLNDKSPMYGGRMTALSQTPDGRQNDNHDCVNEDAPMTDRPQSRRSNAQKARPVAIDDEPEDDTEHDGETGLSRPSVQWTDSETGLAPLAGFKVFIIHVKDTLMDGPHPSERILEELRAQSDEAGLGCEFHVPFQGEEILI